MLQQVKKKKNLFVVMYMKHQIWTCHKYPLPCKHL